MLLVPSFPPLARWSSFWCLASARLVRFLWVMFRVVSSVVLFSPFPVFWVFRAMPVSFPLLPRSVCTLLGALVGIIPGLFRCVLSVLGVFLLHVLLLFLPVLINFCFSSFPFSSLFCGAPGFFAFSPLRHLPLLLLLLGVLRLLLLPFMLIACGVMPLRGFFRVMLFSLLSLQLLLVLLLLSSLRFDRGRCGSPLPVFLFQACCVS